MTSEKQEPNFRWAVPAELGIPPDSLRLRLDFFHQAVEMTFYGGETVTCKPVSAMDVAHALASELTFGSGLLSENALWWRNTRSGPVVALYVQSHVRLIALQTDATKPPVRYKIPFPSLIFICRSGIAPWVFAVKKRPRKETDVVYRAPLANIFANGRSCPGTNKYPSKIEDMVESFFISFFTPTADLQNRSKKYPKNIIGLWKELDKRKTFPLADLVEHGTIKDLLNMEMD